MLGACLLSQGLSDTLESVGADFHLFSRLQCGAHTLWAGIGDHRCTDGVTVGMLFQSLGNHDVHLLRIGGQLDISLGPAPWLASIEIEQTLAQGFRRDRLLLQIHGRVDVQPACVSLGAVLFMHQRASSLCNILGIRRDGGLGSVAQSLRFRLIALFGGDEAVLVHPINDVLLSDRRSARVANRVVGRGGFR